MFANLSSVGNFPTHYTDEGLAVGNRRSTILGVIITLTVLSWICVGLRVYTRVFVIRTPGWDDLVVVVALCTASVSAIGICLSNHSPNIPVFRHFRGYVGLTQNQ
ncbi:hypothetical protein LY78DRAFT_590415 [Colletotrichum sublineola]|nr:hypothetical protein LY78DRAFT_590415 [Colletotrichum sublineola]